MFRCKSLNPYFDADYDVFYRSGLARADAAFQSFLRQHPASDEATPPERIITTIAAAGASFTHGRTLFACDQTWIQESALLAQEAGFRFAPNPTVWIVNLNHGADILQWTARPLKAELVIACGITNPDRPQTLEETGPKGQISPHHFEPDSWKTALEEMQTRMLVNVQTPARANLPLQAFRSAAFEMGPTHELRKPRAVILESLVRSTCLPATARARSFVL